MNTTYLTTRSVPAAAVLRRLRSSLHERLADCYSSVMPSALIRTALDEAADAAASTDFPLLFLPALAEERVRAAARGVATGRASLMSR